MPGLPRDRPTVNEALALLEVRRKHWSPPARPGPLTLVAPLLPGGTSNRSFLLRAGSEELVLRLDGIDPARNAISRDTEFRLHRAASAAGLAPRPRFCDAGAGLLLVDYLPPDAEPAAACAADVADLLHAVHRITIDAPLLSLAARLRHYEAQLASRCDDVTGNLLTGLSALLQPGCHALDAGADVVCHNDLTSANRLYHGGQLYALDWEYAARGSRWFDLAVAADGQHAAGELLQAYLQRMPNAQETVLFEQAQLIARYLELLWLACNTGIAAPALRDGLRELYTRADAMTVLDHAP